MYHFFLCAAATNYKHSWGATWSDQAQSRWANLCQDEEWPWAQRPTSCESCAGFCYCCCCFFVVWVLQVWPWPLGRVFKNKHFNFFWSVFCPLLLFTLICSCLSQAYDQHLNMILGDVEETVTTVEIDEETYEELYKVPHHFLSSPDALLA